MKTLIKVSFILATTLQAANTYYVSSAGNDSNPGSAGSPWLTLNHAVVSVSCGDTINVVANGSYVVGDANLPYIPNCTATTTIQSSALAQFAPVGYRTSPPADAANYGKLQFAATGINASSEAHNGFPCVISSIVGPVITMAFCNAGAAGMTIGSEVEFEVNSEGFFFATSGPFPLNLLQIYYVVSCSNCGSAGGTLSLSSTPGGVPISMTCNTANGCFLGSLVITQSIQVSTSANTFKILDSFSGNANGAPIIFNAYALQNSTMSVPATFLPSPLQINTVYYIVNQSGQTFQVAASPGGPPIPLTTVGSGQIRFSDARSPNNWKFSGLELVEKPGALIFNLFLFGSGNEAGTTVGLVNHMEVDRCWLHDNPSDISGPNRGVADNGQFISVHDSYIAGMRYSEAQAIGGWGSPGPTTVTNNFLEAAGENTLYGGQWPGNTGPNSNKQFIGNYYYKPPSWKTTANTGAATGSCWYDATDPNHAGGEWYTDTSTGLFYQCNSSGVWATSASGPPNIGNPLVKDLAEHKNGQNFLYSGNLMNYVWAQAQSGEAFNNNQEAGSGPGFANDHIMVQNNKITNIYQFVVEGSSCNHAGAILLPCAYPPSIHSYLNNLVVISLSACGVTFTTGSQTCGYHMFLSNWDGYPEESAFWNHNTLWTGDSWSNLYPQNPQAFFVGAGSQYLANWTFKNSIWSGDFNGDGISPCPSPGSGTFPCYFTGATYKNFALLNGTPGAYTNVGATNIFTNVAFPTTNATINYVSGTGLSSGDYHLAATSPYSAQNASATLLSDDGTDLGADIDLINMATSGAAAGTPPWDVQAGLRVAPASTQTVFRYTSPTSDPCTATVYGAPARIPANQVASVADSSANSISNGNSRDLYVSGLQPTKHYWYKLACGGGVLMVGDFFTRGTGHAALQFNFDWSAPTPMQYSSSSSMAGAVSLPAATRQFIPVAINSVVYAQEGIGGPITILIAP
jgi:hypothetical protein